MAGPAGYLERFRKRESAPENLVKGYSYVIGNATLLNSFLCFYLSGMKRALLHVAFWLVYLVQSVLLIFLLNTTRLQLAPGENILLSLYNSLVLLLPKLLFTYFALNVTLHKLITKGFRFKEIAYSALALIFSLLLYRSLVVFFINPQLYGWVDAESTRFFYPLSFPVALMDIGFVSAAAIGFSQARQQLRRIKAEQLLIRQKLETELKYLRNQTNPHFLFNTLNNIYALARKQSDRTAEAVMKLSKLLRFMLYDASKPLISVADEISMIENYIDLEKMRYGGKLSVNFSKEIDDAQELISPLLLLPFVENAFKHGVSESRFDAYVRLELKLKEGILRLIVKNNKEGAAGGAMDAGIGWNNVKRQLELLYADYDIQLNNGGHEFSVLLTINLSTYAENKLLNN